jgi:malonyl CoA-acyl carrier protein transacylase
MLSINPSLIGMDYKTLVSIVEHINRFYFLEISNYNIENKQYILSGTHNSLKLLEYIWETYTYTLDIINQLLKVESINEIHTLCKMEWETPLDDERLNGFTYLNLNIPHHTSYLNKCVSTFRSHFQDLFSKYPVSVLLLEHKYICNLNGRVFSCSKSCIEDLYKITRSEYLEKILDTEQYNTIDILIEICSYKSARSTQWITIQNTLIDELKVNHIMEISPKKILIKMIEKQFEHIEPKLNLDLEYLN